MMLQMDSWLRARHKCIQIQFSFYIFHIGLCHGLGGKGKLMGAGKHRRKPSEECKTHIKYNMM